MRSYPREKVKLIPTDKELVMIIPYLIIAQWKEISAIVISCLWINNRGFFFIEIWVLWWRVVGWSTNNDKNKQTPHQLSSPHTFSHPRKSYFDPQEYSYPPPFTLAKYLSNIPWSIRIRRCQWRLYTVNHLKNVFLYYTLASIYGAPHYPQ